MVRNSKHWLLLEDLGSWFCCVEQGGGRRTFDQRVGADVAHGTFNQKQIDCMDPFSRTKTPWKELSAALDLRGDEGCSVETWIASLKPP